MVESISSKRLILRAVLRDLNPMVLRLVSISDLLELPEFHDIFRTILGWDGGLVVSENSNTLGWALNGIAGAKPSGMTCPAAISVIWPLL
jgi:hypothetical protein